MIDKITLTRVQLQEAFTDFRSIKEFEKFIGWANDNIDSWGRIDFPVIIRTAAATDPVPAAINGALTIPQWEVNDVYIFEAKSFVSGWKEGTEIFWKVPLTTNGLDVADKYVRFELEYGYADVNGAWTFPAVVTTADLLIPGGTTTKTLLIMSIASLTPAIKIGSNIVAKLKRVAAVGAAPTSNPWVPMLQLHIQLDTLGSRTIGAK